MENKVTDLSVFMFSSTSLDIMKKEPPINVFITVTAAREHAITCNLSTTALVGILYATARNVDYCRRIVQSSIKERLWNLL